MERDNRTEIEEIVQDVDRAIRANFAWDVLAGGYIVSSADDIAQYLYYKDYRKIYDDHQRQCTCYALGCQMAEELKKKVAREIFEEIEYLIWQNDTHPASELTEELAELKKKYIGKDINVTTNTEET